jgi:hypothetical protein
MSVRPRKARFFLTVLATAVLIAYCSQSRLLVEYHKIGCHFADTAAVKAGQGRLGILDRVLHLFGRQPVDYTTSLWHHQQALMEAGVLSYQDVTLTHDYDLAVYSPSNLLRVGGELAHVWFRSSRQLVVIAERDRIEPLTRWVYEQDSQSR